MPACRHACSHSAVTSSGFASAGDLGAVRPFDRRKEPDQFVRWELARRPTPEEHGSHRTEPLRRRMVVLGEAGIDIGRHEVVAVGPGGEGAVVTAPAAEGYVKVQAGPERARAGDLSAQGWSRSSPK